MLVNDPNDFELEDIPTSSAPVPSTSKSPSIISPGVDKLAGAVADNFGRILDIASSIAELEHMRIQSDIYRNELREKRLLLAEEAKAYIDSRKVEIDGTVDKLNCIRLLMRDYYRYGHYSLSSEDFSKIISNVLDRLGEL